MRKNLIEFLFGGQVVEHRTAPELGDDIVKMFEEAEELEAVEMVANKKPLADALKSIGISGEVKPSYQMAEITFNNDQEYREATNLLFQPENVHKLAELGWVATRGDGDIAQTNEPPEYKLNFVEISVAGSVSDNSDKAPDLEKVLKDGQKFAATPVDRDDEMNPVDNTRNDKKGEKQAGVGKAKDGEAPEGKPKGSTKKTESKAQAAVDELLESPDLTECGCEQSLGSKRKQAPFFRTDKNLGKKKKMTEEHTCPECGGKFISHGKCATCGHQMKPMGEATMAAAVPAVNDGPPMGATGKTWQDRLDRLRKRRNPNIQK